MIAWFVLRMSTYSLISPNALGFFTGLTLKVGPSTRSYIYTRSNAVFQFCSYFLCQRKLDTSRLLSYRCHLWINVYFSLPSLSLTTPSKTLACLSRRTVAESSPTILHTNSSPAQGPHSKQAKSLKSRMTQSTFVTLDQHKLWISFLENEISTWIRPITASSFPPYTYRRL